MLGSRANFGLSESTNALLMSRPTKSSSEYEMAELLLCATVEELRRRRQALPLTSPAFDLRRLRVRHFYNSISPVSLVLFLLFARGDRRPKAKRGGNFLGPGPVQDLNKIAGTFNCAKMVELSDHDYSRWKTPATKMSIVKSKVKE